MSNYSKQKMHKNQNQRTVLEIILVGFFKGLWWLINLPFKKEKKRSGLSVADKQYVISKRNEIEKMAQSDNMYELKHAVIEADKLVDFILKKKGYYGETFADRLRSAEPYIDHETYQGLWDAHKVRNQIAHDNLDISTQTLRKSVNLLLRQTI